MRDQYEQIKTELAKHLDSELEELNRSLAVSAAELEAMAVNQLRDLAEAKDLGPKELVDIARTASTQVGIHTDKVQLLQGKPTQIVQNDFSDLKKALAQRHGINLTIEGEATEEPIPELSEARQ
jgi:hypothetical protein